MNTFTKVILVFLSLLTSCGSGPDRKPMTFAAALNSGIQLSFTQVTGDFNRPGGGAEQWTARQNVVNIPNQGTNTTRLDAYNRYPWYSLQAGNATGPGLNMTWNQFDADMQDAINKGQGVGIGILVNFGDQAPSVGGSKLVYPTALHNAMQAEGTKDFKNGS